MTRRDHGNGDSPTFREESISTGPDGDDRGGNIELNFAVIQDAESCAIMISLSSGAIGLAGRHPTRLGRHAPTTEEPSLSSEYSRSGPARPVVRSPPTKVFR